MIARIVRQANAPFDGDVKSTSTSLIVWIDAVGG
jgi:hypothetical protein